jgi:hypothetical protein
MENLSFIKRVLSSNNKVVKHVCVCVCVREREREREIKLVGDTQQLIRDVGDLETLTGLYYCYDHSSKVHLQMV